MRCANERGNPSVSAKLIDCTFGPSERCASRPFTLAPGERWAFGYLLNGSPQRALPLALDRDQLAVARLGFETDRELDLERSGR
jgi:hypothetical protein